MLSCTTSKTSGWDFVRLGFCPVGILSVEILSVGIMSVGILSSHQFIVTFQPSIILTFSNEVQPIYPISKQEMLMNLDCNFQAIFIVTFQPSIIMIFSNEVQLIYPISKQEGLMNLDCNFQAIDSRHGQCAGLTK